MRYFVKFLSAFFAFACVLAPLLVAPASAATPEATLIAEVTVTQLNYRNGPGLSYSVTGCFSLGDVVSLTGETVDADGYTWYRCATADTRWVAQVDSMNITPISPTGYTDTITGYDAYGDVVWEHTCTQNTADWYYHFEVKNQSYIVSCDCGWFYERKCPIWLFEDGSYESIFLGLDTDNNEFYDLKPGQSKDIPCRANSEYRPYQILEFYGDTNNDPPTVTMCIWENGVSQEYVFNWNVKVELKSYGLQFTGSDGNIEIHRISGEYMVLHTNRPNGADDVYLATDKIYEFKHGQLLDEDPWFGDGRHVAYHLQVTIVDFAEMSPLDWITYISRKVGTWLEDLVGLFGLGDHVTDEDSPFTQLIKLDGIQEFFLSISEFFATLPKRTLLLCTLPFMGFALIGLVRWLL